MYIYVKQYIRKKTNRSTLTFKETKNGSYKNDFGLYLSLQYEYYFPPGMNYLFQHQIRKNIVYSCHSPFEKYIKGENHVSAQTQEAFIEPLWRPASETDPSWNVLQTQPCYVSLLWRSPLQPGPHISRCISTLTPSTAP